MNRAVRRLISEEATNEGDSQGAPRAGQSLVRVTETADWLEWRDWGVPFPAEPFEVRDSAIHIPDRPGAGIAWDEAAVKKFAI